jgi:N-acetylglucosamine repressor
VEKLQESNLIEEIGAGNSNGGRKPTLLKLRTGTPIALGVDVTPRKTTIALADLTGNVLIKEVIPTSSDLEFMSDRILEKISELLKTMPVIPNNFEIGISLPGIIDYINGTSIYIPYFQSRNWDIARQIGEKFNLPVTMDNDANAIALAELWFGQGKIKKVSNFINVHIGEGIGTGIIFDGQIYRGEKGAAGEFGHMIIGSESDVTCSCGSTNCWEAHASEKSILARYYKLSKNSSHTDGVGIEQLISLATLGEESAVSALKETAKYIGIGLSNLIVGLSPQAIVMSGQIIKAWDLISREILNITERSVRRDLTQPILIPSSLGDSPTLIGAFCLVLAKKFASAQKF